jgi:hypothetical protein
MLPPVVSDWKGARASVAKKSAWTIKMFKVQCHGRDARAPLARNPLFFHLGHA